MCVPFIYLQNFIIFDRAGSLLLHRRFLELQRAERTLAVVRGPRIVEVSRGGAQGLGCRSLLSCRAWAQQLCLLS